MNSNDFESPSIRSEAQETVNGSSTYTVASINCQATSVPRSSVGDIENDSPKSLQTNNISTQQSAMDVLAPVINHDATLPNAIRKVPMVMVPVSDSQNLMIPLATFNQFKTHMDTFKDEQQARDLLVWNEGVGTLTGCDLRFKINQLGCLELLDSDDECENQNILKSNAISKASNQSINSIIDKKPKSTSSAPSSTNTANSDSLFNNDNFQKRAKLEFEPTPVKQISPGSSLLKDGPHIRRPRSSLGSTNTSYGRPHGTSLSLLKKIEQNHNSILLEKLVPKQKLEEMRTQVGQWTTEDVKNFVDGIPGCTGYGELFETQQICGNSLMYLDQKDLLDVINVKLGPAVKIYHAISLLK